MARARIGQRFTVVLPKDVRSGLEINDPVEVIRRDDGVVEIRPMMLVDKTQAWFWTPEWQEKERAADADYAAGRFRTHDSTEDFLTALDRASVAEDPSPSGE